MKVYKRNTRQIEDKHIENNDKDEINKKADQIIQAALEGKYGSMRYDYKGDTNEGEVTVVKDEINIKEALSNPILKNFLTNSIINQISLEKELSLPIAFDQFMNGNFLASSSVVLNEDTAMKQDLCTHRKLKTYYIDEEDIKNVKKQTKNAKRKFYRKKSKLKDYCAKYLLKF